jgi:rhodanese-related sulfurtransferase
MEIDVHELAAGWAGGAIVIDVREPAEYHAGHVPGAWLIPLGELPERVGELAGLGQLLVICASGNRSLTAAKWLGAQGYDALSVSGGTAAWQQAGHPVESGPPAAPA